MNSYNNNNRKSGHDHDFQPHTQVNVLQLELDYVWLRQQKLHCMSLTGIDVDFLLVHMLFAT